MIIQVSKVNKSYIDKEVLKDISLVLEKDDKACLVGVNGSGKTTLLEVLRGTLLPDSGTVWKRPNLKIGYLTQHPDFDFEKTSREILTEVFSDLIEEEKEIHALAETLGEIDDENDPRLHEYTERLEAFEEKGGYEYPSRIRGMLAGLGFREEEIDHPSGMLSGGQKSRLLLARTLLEDADLLLLDEPTNHLDLSSVRFLEDYLMNFPRAVLFVSHDRAFIDRVATKIFHLESHELTRYAMRYTKYVEERKKDERNKIEKYLSDQKEIERQEEIVRRFSNYGRERYIKQARSRAKLVERMKADLSKPVALKDPMKLHFHAFVQGGKDALIAEDLSMAFDGVPLFRDLHFAIYRGEKVALLGDNGTGKSTIFRLIMEELTPTSGEIRIGSSHRIAYFDQEQRNLDPDKTVIDDLWDNYPKMSQFEIRSALAAFSFIGEDLFREVGELSGGERARLSLLKLMLGKANVLLLDEPTNHLDIASAEILEDALLEYPGTLFFISHDRYFVNRIADRVLVLENGGIREYEGNYDYYEKKRREEEEPEPEEKVTRTEAKKQREKERAMRAEEKKTRQARERIEKNIADWERESAEINAYLADSANYDELEEIQKKHARLLELEEKLEEAYEAWMEFEK